MIYSDGVSAGAFAEEHKTWLREKLEMTSPHEDSLGVSRDLLAACLLNAGRVEELTRLPCEHADVCYWQGLGYAQQRLRDQAVARLRQALVQQPDHQRAQAALITLAEQRFLSCVAEEGWLSAVNARVEAQQVGLAEATAHQLTHDDTKLIKMLAWLLAGQRKEAVHILEEALKRDPDDPTVIHSMGLASYYAARVLRKEGREKEAEHFWRRAVAAWVAILNEDTFWEPWQEQIRKRYQVEIAAQDVSLFRKQLEESLIRLFLQMPEKVTETDGSGGDRHHQQNSHGRKSEHERLLHRELKAAATLQQVGGFALPGSTYKRLVCGPLMIQLLGCETEFGQFVTDLPVRKENVSELLELLQRLFSQDLDQFEEQLSPDPAQKRRLKRYFSQLGMAQAMLDLSRPEEALETLTDISCQACRDASHRRPSQSTFAGEAIIVCGGDCPNFDHANPGYTGSTDKELSLIMDAIELATEAHLAAAQKNLTAATMNLEAACTHWKRAIEVARELGAESREETQRKIVEAALGRSEALQSDDRLDEAIALLDQTEGICDSRHRRELRGRLSECLTNRGVTAGNKTPPNWSAAANDLRRAVNLNPHAVRPRTNLCTVLNAWAGENFNRGEEHAAIRLLEEVSQRVKEANSADTNHPKLQTHLEEANKALSVIHNARGVRLAEEENWTGAVNAMDSAISLTPRNQTVQQNLKQIHRAYALYLFKQGQPRECKQVLERLLRRFPNDLPAQKDLEQVQLMLSLMEGRRRWSR